MASEVFTTIVEFLRAGNLLGDPEATPETLRASMSGGAGVVPLAADVTVEPTVAGGVPGEWVRTDGVETDAALLYLHGGGYVIGSPETHRNLCATLARGVGVAVLSLDYRLAPEHPHPAAVEDAAAAYAWLLHEGYTPSRLAIAGDSAGGGLTAATLVAARDRGLPQPAAAALISPWVDIAMTGESMRTLAAADPMVHPGGLARMAAWFLDGGDPRDPSASPLYADLSGLAPMLVHVGEVETLLDDSRRFAAAVQAAGGTCTLVEFPEMIHVFHVFCGLVPEADVAVAALADFLRDRLGV